MGRAQAPMTPPDTAEFGTAVLEEAMRDRPAFPQPSSKGQSAPSSASSASSSSPLRVPPGQNFHKKIHTENPYKKQLPCRLLCACNFPPRVSLARSRCVATHPPLCTAAEKSQSSNDQTLIIPYTENVCPGRRPDPGCPRLRGGPCSCPRCPCPGARRGVPAPRSPNALPFRLSLRRRARPHCHRGHAF